jgi:hypothetical protein
VNVVNQIENGITFVLFWGMLALRVWALGDCLARKGAAFPAAGKLTKPAWILLTALSVVIGVALPSPLGFLSLISLVISMVYLADVRPAVREISGGSRW